MSEALTTHAPATQVLTGSVPEGKVVDFVTGKFVNDTSEEYVRQNVERDLLRRFGYARELCRPEFRIKVGSSRKAVDIAIFQAAEQQRQEDIYIIVECKKPGTHPQNKREGVEQLKSYLAASINARYGLWTNGDDRYCFAKRQKAGSYEFEEVVEIPAFGQSEEDAQRPRVKDLKPATADNLLFAFRRCHNYIAGTDGMHKTEAFWELLKLIFCKIEDERTRRLEFYVTPSELNSATSATATKTRIERLFSERVVKKYPAIFAAPEAQSISLKANTVAFVVGQLQAYSLLRSPVDVKGKAYEEIVGANLRGDRGEFFTPRNACLMAVDMLNPQPGERLLDPACGTGGFLITAMNHALALIDRAERSEWADPARGNEWEVRELEERRHDYLTRCVSGLDFNPALVRAAKMNMVMNNDGAGGLFQADSLENPYVWSSNARSAVALGAFDVLVTNPPFGANIVIDNEDVLRQYDLAAMWAEDDEGVWHMRRDKHGHPILQKSLPPEILFIERCVQFLRDDGRFAMVVPNGILNNPALGYVRQWLLRNTQVTAVIDMARELFQPRNDTQTSMVIARRLTAEERHKTEAAQLDYPIFMAVAERVGHDKRGNAIYRRTPTGDDVLVSRVETIAEPDPMTGEATYVEVEVSERQPDDELPEVARAYRQWLNDHT